MVVGMAGQRVARKRGRAALKTGAAVGVLAGLIALSVTDPFGGDPAPAAAPTATDPTSGSTSATTPVDEASLPTPSSTARTDPGSADGAGSGNGTDDAKDDEKGDGQDGQDKVRPVSLTSMMLRRTVERQLEQSGQLPLTTEGVLGEVTAPLGVPMTGDVSVSVANIPNTRADANWASSVGALIAGAPDFVTLNEVFKHSNEGIEAVAPGYTVHRASGPDTSPGAAGQSQNNALLYRTDEWTMRAGGMVRVVDDDRGYLRGKAFLWDRFAVWSVLQNDEGNVVSLISTHMPTNPGRYPAQPGGGMSRVQRYSEGMDTLVAMVDQLERYGPVLVGGDMNSHPDQGSWTAAAKLGAAGYTFTKDQGVMYLFADDDTSVVSTRQIRIVSDHPALLTTLSMNGLGPRED